MSSLRAASADRAGCATVQRVWAADCGRRGAAGGAQPGARGCRGRTGGEERCSTAGRRRRDGGVWEVCEEGGERVTKCERVVRSRGGRNGEGSLGGIHKKRTRRGGFCRRRRRRRKERTEDDKIHRESERELGREPRVVGNDDDEGGMSGFAWHNFVTQWREHHPSLVSSDRRLPGCLPWRAAVFPEPDGGVLIGRWECSNRGLNRANRSTPGRCGAA